MSTGGLGVRVNLRPLQGAAVIHVDALPFRENVDAGDAGLAVTVARLLDAAEGQVDFSADGGGVDVNDAGVEVAHGREGTVDVLRVDGGGQPVDHSVGDLDALLEAVKRNHGDHRPEDLFLRDAHLRVAVAEDGGRVEGAFVAVAAGKRRAAAEQPRAFVLADCDVLVDALALLVVDAGAHLDRGVEAVAHLQALRPLDEPVEELLVDLLVDAHAAGGGAALAGSAEAAPEPPVHRQLEI